jgi:uncharacterized membrane protein
VLLAIVYLQFDDLKMKKAARFILPLSIAMVVYGYWGAFTKAGNRVYDEMDGLLPFFVLIVGLILLIVVLVLIFLMKRKSAVKGDNQDASK